MTGLHALVWRVPSAVKVSTTIPTYWLLLLTGTLRFLSMKTKQQMRDQKTRWLHSSLLHPVAPAQRLLTTFMERVQTGCHLHCNCATATAIPWSGRESVLSCREAVWLRALELLTRGDAVASI